MNPSEDEQHATVAEREREAIAVEMAGLRRKAAAHDEALALFENSSKPTPGNLMDYVLPLSEEFMRLEDVAAALRRDAERWRWAKWHPAIAVYVFDVEWMEQRDFDAAIDMEMQQADPIKPCTNCTRCLFDCRNGKWNLNGQVMDCFGCEGSGIDTRCEEHKEEAA